MKKFIIGALAIVTIGFGGVLAVNATVTNGPQMVLTTSDTEIEAYKDTEFEVNLDLDAGIIKSKGMSDKRLDNIKIKLNDISNFEVISVEGTVLNYPNTSEIPIEIIGEVIGGTVDIGSFDYKYNSKHNGATPTIYELEGPKVTLKLKLKAKTAGTFELNNIIGVHYYNHEGNPGNAMLPNGETDIKIPIKVSELTYEMGNVTGIDGEPGAVIRPTMGNYFDLNYIINPGELKVKDSSIKKIQSENRNMVYVVDKNVIDQVSGNEETARQSIIKSLEETNRTNPEATASLVIYGEKAEIVKVNDKTVFTISDLIAQISNIETMEKSGNIGDAIRMAQVLINETESEDSVVLVSGGDANYYTQVSEGNSAMLATRVAKDGFVVEDKEKADEYANKVIEDIIVNEEDDTRWYGVNYALEKEEILSDSLIERLEGTPLNVKRPYYDNFVEINTKAVAPLVIKGNLFVSTTEETKNSIEVHPLDKDKVVELVFNEEGGVIVGKSQNVAVRLRVNNIDDFSTVELEAMGIDIASKENLKVELKVKFGEIEESYIFNSKVIPPNEKLLTWYLKPRTPYTAKVGLYNGRITLPTGILSEEENPGDIGLIAPQLLEEAPEFALAEENHFGLGILLKVDSSEDSFDVVTRDNAKSETRSYTGKYNLYELDRLNNKFITSTDSNKNLDPNKIYLITIDHYIDGQSPGQIPGQSFEIGINVNTTDTITTNGTTTSEKITEFRGIKVNTVDKPEHF